MKIFPKQVNFKARNIYTFFLGGLVAFTFVAAVAYDTGPPAALTGAPNSTGKESTCTKCHAGTVNSGSGKGILTLGDTSKLYKPGATYELELTCNDASINKFGFQITALDEANNPVGTFPKPAVPTQQLLTSVDGKLTRTYITHTKKGTSTTTPGATVWKIKWTAPATSEGKITFYVAWMASNAGTGERGDKVYNFTQSFDPDLTNLESKELPQSWSISPNPSNGTIKLNFPLNDARNVDLQLVDLQGKTVYRQSWEGVSGTFSPAIETPNLPSGVYTVKIQAGSQSFAKRIVIE